MITIPVTLTCDRKKCGKVEIIDAEISPQQGDARDPLVWTIGWGEYELPGTWIRRGAGVFCCGACHDAYWKER